MMKKLNQLTKQDIEQMTYSEQRFTKAAFVYKVYVSKIKIIVLNLLVRLHSLF